MTTQIIQQNTATMPAFNIGHTATMSSREIAELTGRRHDQVLRTARDLVAQGVTQSVETPYLHEQNGQQYPEHRLSKRDSLVLVARLSPEFTARIVDRWQELELKNSVAIPDFSNPAAAARAWAEQYEARHIAEATKAEIGSRREATAMNTASQAVKKVNKLEIALDQSKQYATVKRMEMLYQGVKFSWRLLKSTSIQMEMPPIDVFDQNYGTVKAYHADVWRETYALDIEVA